MTMERRKEYTWKEGDVRDGMKVVPVYPSVVCEAPDWWCDGVCSLCDQCHARFHWEQIHPNGMVTSEIEQAKSTDKHRKEQLRHAGRLRLLSFLLFHAGVVMSLNFFFHAFWSVFTYVGLFLSLSGIVMFLYGSRLSKSVRSSGQVIQNNIYM